MPHMSLQSLHLFGHGVEVFSIILLPRGLHSPKSGTGRRISQRNWADMKDYLLIQLAVCAIRVN